MAFSTCDVGSRAPDSRGDEASWAARFLGRHKLPPVRATHGCRLTGQSLVRAERNSNERNWSTARKKIGPVNRPCDRPIDVISIASLIFLVTSRLADQRKKTGDFGKSYAIRAGHRSEPLSFRVRIALTGGGRSVADLPMWMPDYDRMSWWKALSVGFFVLIPLQ